MRIKHLLVERFRGINRLDWKTNRTTLCLIGSGDSTKSTILDAIDYALVPRWDLPITDADFYQGIVDLPIEITVSVGGELPKRFLDDQKFGLHFRGWNESRGVVDEPGTDEEVLSIRLTIDSSLEPRWTVFTERHKDHPAFTYWDRRALGVARLGVYLDPYFSWGRGSPLSDVKDKADGVAAALATARRTARSSMKDSDIDVLQDGAQRVSDAAKRFGIKPATSYRAAIDPKALSGGAGSIALHDGDVPIRMYGLGTRRLLSIAIQRDRAENQSTLVIDEVEQGLEPHRLRHLVRILRSGEIKAASKATSAVEGQTFMTTHSPVVVTELRAEDLYVVRSHKGTTVVQQIPQHMEKTIRFSAESVLARKIIVCEGRTEVGICRALDSNWAEEPDGMAMAITGTAPADGVGSNAPEVACAFADLGYGVLLFRDSDRMLPSGQSAEVKARGLRVVEWADDSCTEVRACHDLPLVALREVVQFPMTVTQIHYRQVHAQIRRELNAVKQVPHDDNIEKWLEDWESDGFLEDQIRGAIGRAAHENRWFKTAIDQGEWLGNLIYRHLSAIPKSDLAKKIALIKAWIYAE